MRDKIIPLPGRVRWHLLSDAVDNDKTDPPSVEGIIKQSISDTDRVWAQMKVGSRLLTSWQSDH